MKGLDANNLCSHGGDMLAYLYNEMQSADRDTFEVHLADCGTCIDDFAELSQSRYPVFEWKQLEFDPMPTPQVVIPFDEGNVSWFDKLRASFAFRPTLAFGSLAAIAVVASMAAFVLIGDTNTKSDIAEVAPVVTPVLPTPEVDLPLSDRASTSVPAVDEPEIVDRRSEGPRAIKASSGVSKQSERAVKPKPTQQAKRNDRIPTLNAVEDDEDDSLRLADMFEEIGTSESR